MNKKAIVAITLLSFCIFGLTVSAETITDSTADVAHWSYTETTWSWDQNLGTKPDIDITELTSALSGESIIITMKVQGSIQTSQYYFYGFWFNTSDAGYWCVWANGQGTALATGTADQPQMVIGDVTVSEDTMTATFNMIGDDTSAEEFYGYAYEYKSLTETISGEYWGDWVPNTDAPFTDDSTNDDDTDDTTDDTNDDNTTDDTTDDNNDDSSDDQDNQETGGSPGFELIFLLSGIILLVFILKRRK